MKRIALIYPNNNKSDYKPNKIYEPSGLLGIYNILKKNSNCLFIDCVKDKYTSSDLVDILKQFNPDFLLLSVHDVREIIEFTKNVIDSMRIFNPNILIIVGGPGAIHGTVKIANLLNPDYLIKGEGENYFSEFIKNFNPECMEYEMVDSVKIINSKYPENMDDIGYERDYSLKKYEYMAMPNLQRGCAGNCIYCTGCGYTKIRYKSPTIAANEIEYLRDVHSAECIMPLGPDFTVIPKNALEIIRELNKRGVSNLKYIFVTRLDSLCKSIALNEKEWEHFFNNNTVTFQIGIESFSKEKLVRLGKYINDNQYADIQYNLLEGLLDKYNIIINAYFILIDPLSTKEEIIGDINLIDILLEKYPSKFIVTGKIINYLELYENTRAIEQFGDSKTNDFMNGLVQYADEINSSRVLKENKK